MWTELSGETGKEKKVVTWPKRESRLRAKEQLESAGLPDSHAGGCRIEDR